MHNDDAPLNGKYLGTITGDFVQVADKLREASYLIRKRGKYAYPVFLIAKVPIAIGALLIDKHTVNNEWYYYAAYLDVLVQCGIIAKDKRAAFQSTYKDPDTFCCLLVIDDRGTHFIYVPYPEE